MDRADAMVPADVARVHAQFEAWRRTRTQRSIPEDLWSAAARLAAEYGVAYTSRALRLDYYNLKRRLEAVHDEGEESPIEFVDLPLAVPDESATECVGMADLDDGRGARMRVAWRGRAPDLAALSRSFYGGAR